MTPLAVYTKDPIAKLDYQMDWSEYLSGDDTISASVWTIISAQLSAGGSSESPPALILSNETRTDAKTTVWVEAGTDGVGYVLGNKITTRDGRIDTRSIKIDVLKF